MPELWSDSALLTALQSNQEEGLERLFRKYYAYMTRLSLYLTKNQEIAEDLTQEVFVSIWEKRGQLAQIENLKAYLSIAIRNRSLDYLRNQKTAQSHLSQYLKWQEQSEDESDNHLEELKQQIAQGLELLPPKCRLVFSLNRFEGLTNDEIATYLQISKRTVETQISKALKILRTELAGVLKNLILIFF